MHLFVRLRIIQSNHTTGYPARILYIRTFDQGHRHGGMSHIAAPVGIFEKKSSTKKISTQILGNSVSKRKKIENFVGTKRHSPNFLTTVMVLTIIHP